MHEVPEEIEVLLAQGLIEAKLGAQFSFHVLRCAASQHRIHRIARSDPQEQKHQGGDQPEHHRRQGQARAGVAQQFASATH